MTRRIAGPLIVGVLGTAILIALGVWQLQRLDWKRTILAEIDARIAAAPVPLPADPDPRRDRFQPVIVEGRILPQTLRVVTTDAGGAAFRLISPIETDGRRILLDRGVIASDVPVPAPPTGLVTVRGNLHWPDESDAFTPPPDPSEGLWYARDLETMAQALGAEPVLVVARDLPGDPAAPRPIDTSAIPNDHLEYALTWFSLAAIWAGMTLALLWRIRRRIG